MTDDPRDDQQDSGAGAPGDYPAPWSRREEGTVDMAASEEGEATYLAGEDMSLDSKLRGGGKDQSPAAGPATRLCPACNTVTVFVDGKCTNCDYLIGSTGHESVAGIRQAVEGDEENPFIKVLLILGIVVVVGVLLIFGIPRLLANRAPAVEEAAEEAEVEMYQSETVYAGALNEIEISETLHSDVAAALEAGNTGWAAEGLDAYVYKYNISNTIVTATSQTLRISTYVGGKDAAVAVTEPKNIPFNLGTADLLDRLNATPGVEASFRLYDTGGLEPVDSDDVYLRYGYYYGKEHMRDLQPLLDSLSEYYKSKGEYPHLLSDKLGGTRFKTKRGFYFVSDGLGYLPVFRTNRSGEIVMGSGTGVASLQPEACIGYYLFLYTQSPSEGLDIHGPDAADYYSKQIAPFPYAPDDPVRNVVLEPDGEPDGIACVIKDGVLLDM